MANLRLGEFFIQSFDPDFIARCEFGNGAALPTSDSYGGWTVTGIPKRMGLTEWAGRTPMGIDIEFIIDRFEEGDSDWVERQFQNLERIGGRYRRNDEPPVCIIESGGMMPHDHTHNPRSRWVIEGISWDRDITIVSVRKRLLRVGGSMTIREYNHDETVDSYDGPAGKNRKKHNNKKGRGKPYTVREGDTLVSIARRRLDDSKRWHEIAKLNNIRNPRKGKDLRVGRVLRMPKK